MPGYDAFEVSQQALELAQFGAGPPRTRYQRGKVVRLVVAHVSGLRRRPWPRQWLRLSLFAGSGRTRQRVFQLTQQPDFPAPVAVLAMGKVWKTIDVRRWAARTATSCLTGISRHRQTGPS